MTVKVASAVSECFSSGKYSDLTISCGDTREFKVHKIVVCPQSEYFSNAVAEGRYKEGQTGVIQLPAEDDPDAVKALVDFFYTADYETPGQNSFSPLVKKVKPEPVAIEPISYHYSNRGHSRLVKRQPRISTFAETPEPPTTFDFDLSSGIKHPLLFHLAVYEVADRRQQPDLKNLAESKFEQTAVGSWTHAQFTAAIRKVYDIAPPGTHGDRLRKIVLKVTAEHTKEMFTMADFADVLREVHDFSADLNASLCGHESLSYNQVSSAAGETFTCRGCDSSFTIKVPLRQQSMTCPVCTAGLSMEEWRGMC